MLGSNEGWQRAERQSIALRRTNREVSVRWEGPCRKGSGGLPGQGAGGGEGSKTACRCLGPPLRAQLASWKPGPTSRCFPERGPPAPLSPHELNRVMPQKGDRDQSEWTATLGDLQLPQEGAPGHRGFWGASASILPVNSQDSSPLEWSGWISLQSKGLSRVFSNTTVQKHQFFGQLL